MSTEFLPVPEVDTIPKAFTGIEDDEISTTLGWVLAKRFTFPLKSARYVVILSAQVRSNNSATRQVTRVDITDNWQVLRWWGGDLFENKTAIFILDATEKDYDFDFMFGRHSGTGTVYISDIRISVMEIEEAS